MKLKNIFFSLFLFCFCFRAEAAPYGPTLNEVVQNYAVTRSFQNLISNLEKENIDIRLGMTKNDVERWASRSKIYKVVSRKGSIYKFDPKDTLPTFCDMSFEVWLRKDIVVAIKTHNLNNFEDADVRELKPLKEKRLNSCWVMRNYVDTSSMKNGYDFVLYTERNVPEVSEEYCMGSDRANITIGQPGLLYPKHVQK
ncbi:MAG: hypothetical protein IK079_01945 [Desulfovibrio sp.]|nr:hypothetical protein [Desulfovibrio sp.]